MRFFFQIYVDFRSFFKAFLLLMVDISGIESKVMWKFIKNKFNFKKKWNKFSISKILNFFYFSEQFLQSYNKLHHVQPINQIRIFSNQSVTTFSRFTQLSFCRIPYVLYIRNPWFSG